MARKAEWEKPRKRSAKRFGEDPVFGEGYLDSRLVVKPHALILLGSTPAKALIEKSFTLKSGRGTPLDSELGLPALATYHPSYLLRLRGASSEDYDQMRAQVVEDLGTAWEHARGSRDG